MAHSIPPNLGRGNISLKNETNSKKKIKDQMNKEQKKISHSQQSFKDKSHVCYTKMAC
jgi:hypothetical protein